MIIFIFPFITSFFLNSDIFQLLNNESNGLTPSLYRTTIFALISALICTIGGFVLAILLSNIQFHSKFGRILSVFMLPITLGNVTVAYIFKLTFFNTAFFDRIVDGGNLYQLGLLIIIQFWQYGFLFSYLFWIRIQGIPKKEITYSSIIKHTRMEKFKDVILPNVKNIFILLFFMAFIFSFYENAKSSFIFKASQGTNTELISQSFSRIYQSNLLINPDFAHQTTLKTGGIIFFSLFALIFVMGLFLSKSIGELSRKRNRINRVYSNYTLTQRSQVLIYLIGVMSIFIIILPVIISLLKSKYHFSLEIVGESSFVFIITIISALFATLLAILFGISSRVIFHQWLKDFNSKSLGYLLSVFMLQLIPPLCIIICAFKWLAAVGYSMDFLVYLVWILGHSILVFPIIGSFVLITHFAIRKNELDYLSVHKISTFDILNIAFSNAFEPNIF